jgi:hypothetical protein
MLDLTVLPHNASQNRRQAGIVAAAAGRRLISERTKMDQHDKYDMTDLLGSVLGVINPQLQL